MECSARLWTLDFCSHSKLGVLTSFALVLGSTRILVNFLRRDPEVVIT